MIPAACPSIAEVVHARKIVSEKALLIGSADVHLIEKAAPRMPPRKPLAAPIRAATITA